MPFDLVVSSCNLFGAGGGGGSGRRSAHPPKSLDLPKLSVSNVALGLRIFGDGFSATSCEDSWLCKNNFVEVFAEHRGLPRYRSKICFAPPDANQAVLPNDDLNIIVRPYSLAAWLCCIERLQDITAAKHHKLNFATLRAIRPNSNWNLAELGCETRNHLNCWCPLTSAQAFPACTT